MTSAVAKRAPFGGVVKGARLATGLRVARRALARLGSLLLLLALTLAAAAAPLVAARLSVPVCGAALVILMMITRTSARLLAATLVLAAAASTAAAAAAASAAAATVAPLLCLLPGIGAECCDVDLALGGVEVAVVPGGQELADEEVPFGCREGGDGANGGRRHSSARMV